jgi:hypothetical protein
MPRSLHNNLKHKKAKEYFSWKMLMLFILLLFNTSLSIAQIKYSNVKIYLPDNKMERLDLLGLLEVDHFEEINGAFNYTVDQEELALLKSSGYKYEIINDDAVKYLEEENQKYYDAIKSNPSSRVAFERTGDLVDSIIKTPSAFVVQPTLGGYYRFSSQKILAQSAYSDISQATTDFQGNNYLMNADNNALYQGINELENEKNNTPLTQTPINTEVAEDKNIYDYGDAPSSYGTAFHLYKKTPKLKLGTFIDYSTGSVNNSYATADDKQNTGEINDEDGVPYFPLIYASYGSYTVSANVTNITGEAAYLYGFIDFNGDGDFNDAGETSDLTTVPNGATSVNVNWTGLSGHLTAGATFARFRISSVYTEIQYATGYAATGEVEDYPIIIAGSVLPVEFASFTTKLQNDKTTLLKWKTASEYNCDFFEVQHSKDALEWENIGSVKGSGNTHWISAYSFVDPNPFSGFTYYRLRQVDFDDRFRFSELATVKNDTTEIEVNGYVTVFPNPTKEEIWIKTENKKKDADVQVYNYVGQNMYNMKLTKGLQNISISTYPSGMYMVIIDDKLFKIIKE